MQNTVAQKFQVIEVSKALIPPLRVISLRPSVWKRVSAWAGRTLTKRLARKQGS